MTRRLTLLFAFVIVLSVGLLRFYPNSLLSEPKPTDTQPGWEIRLLLTTEGEYRMEDGGETYTGHFAFTILWTGSIEPDDSDFLLYHKSCELLEWEAQEQDKRSEGVRLLSTADFEDKPNMKFNYILKNEGQIWFDFAVEGFFVPQGESPEKFYIHLPSAAENTQLLSEVKYDSFLKKGSNRISIEEKEILGSAAEKKFCWTWKRPQWILRQNRTIFTSNSHSARVEITVTPRPLK